MKSKSMIMLTAVLILPSVWPMGAATAATLVVDANGGADFSSIQETIDAAWDYDTIEVCPGVYQEHIDYHGTILTIRSVDPNDPAVVESTIIDGGGTGNVAMFHNSEGPNSVLQGLTIRNGQNGIECIGADTSPWIDKCRVVSNTVGVACSLASPTVTETTIEDNNTVGISGSFGKINLCRIFGNGSRADGHAGLANCQRLVSECVISGNNGDGIYNQAGEVKNCLISANTKNGLYFKTANCNITNCTIVGNTNNGIFLDTQVGSLIVNLSNSIIVQNGNFAVYGKRGVWGWNYGSVSVSWSNVFGNIDGDYCVTIDVTLVTYHNISVDPLFAKRGYWDAIMIWHEGDYHLKSMLGRWDTRTMTWVTDLEDSPCLDRGDPNDGFGDEPYPHGGRINLGAYGGTAEASKSEGPKPMCIEYPEMDFNKDCKVDFADLALFIEHWMECKLDPQDACW